MRACVECGHEHHGPELGGICIGCPCPDRPAQRGLDAEQVDHLRRMLRAMKGHADHALSKAPTADGYAAGLATGLAEGHNDALKLIGQLLAEQPAPTS